jgi:hypothetical protein
MVGGEVVRRDTLVIEIEAAREPAQISRISSSFFLRVWSTFWTY